MGYKQPRVPEIHEGESERQYLKSLVLFLKDFTMDAWKADMRREKEIAVIGKCVSSMTAEVRGQEAQTQRD